MARKFIISGGGTGGHIFPAISVADEIRRREPDADILFVGADGGMEMNVVPRYHYPIESVWISGLHRQLNLRNILRNLSFPFKVITSQFQASRIISRFRPAAVVGFGGFASWPVGQVAGRKRIPLFLCEANAFPGLVNRRLAPKATRILLGNGDAQKYFDASKTITTGNPIRSFEVPDKVAAAKSLGLNPDQPILLSLGGSLGALSLNNALEGQLDTLMQADIQLVWQCGKRYYEALVQRVPKHPNLKLMAFIEDMAAAYGAADLVISRAGGSTISELIELAKPAILVPSPNVAEDHQTKNALSLSEKDAAVLVKDVAAKSQLAAEAIDILTQPGRLAALQTGISRMEKHNSASEIVNEIFQHLN
ncbi:MAG: undecaprenyldiphospho-muramoylpentapeptide beta-N-acetylglucosaminyltransferase [Bacteroidota bacterium]